MNKNSILSKFYYIANKNLEMIKLKSDLNYKIEEIEKLFTEYETQLKELEDNNNGFDISMFNEMKKEINDTINSFDKFKKRKEKLENIKNRL